jgi:peptide/nickel transport system substrate-binding protein
MFVAAWSGSADPDIYQVFHAGAPSNYCHIDDGELNRLIEAARAKADRHYRKAMYKDCWDIILDQAVIVPVYQRKNCQVYNATKVKVETITPDVTPYWSYLAEIHKLKVK